MRTRIALYILFALISFSACQKEQVPDVAETANAMFRLYLQPEGMTAENMTRAFTPVDEDVVNELDVLVFDRSTQRYLTTYSPAVVPSGNQYTIEFKMQITSGPVDLVLIANAHTEVEAAVTNFTSSTLRTDAMAALTYLLMDQNLQYAWGTGAAYRGMPMSGQLDNVDISTNNQSKELTTSTSPVVLTRNVAKVIVKNEATAKFMMQNVWLYNMQTVTSIGSTLPKTDTLTKLSAPALLEDVPYIVPHDNATTQTLVSPNAPYLVVGGMYNGRQTFYRIDFYTTTALDVEANHQYIFTIKDILRPGWDKQADAAAQETGDNVRSNTGKSPNITVGIDHPSLAYIHEDYLYISKAYIVGGSTAFNESVDVLTSNGDWTFSNSATSWLNVTKLVNKLTFSAQATSSNRKATVTIHSNRLEQKIVVEQLVNGFCIVDAQGKEYYPSLVPASGTVQEYYRIEANLPPPPVESGFYRVKCAYDWGIEYIIIDDNPTPLITNFTQTGLKGLTYWKYDIRPLTQLETDSKYRRDDTATIGFINIADGSNICKVKFTYK